MASLEATSTLEKRDKLAILSLSAGHFINDAYSNFLGPLLPLLMANLNLSITQAGWLGGILVFSSSFTQPLYGYISDRYLKRFFAVFSPLITAVFMSCIGLAPNFWILAGLLACGGIGIASFHPQSAAMTSFASRNRRGLGMSIFVTSGTIGYSLGPIFITYAVEYLGIERSYLVMIPGIIVFLSLYFLLPSLEHSSKTDRWRQPGMVSGKVLATAPSSLRACCHTLSGSDLLCELSSPVPLPERPNGYRRGQANLSFPVLWGHRRFQRRDLSR